MLLTELVEASEAVGATRSRLEKVDRIAAVLRRLAPDEVEAGVAFPEVVDGWSVRCLVDDE